MEFFLAHLFFLRLELGCGWQSGSNRGPCHEALKPCHSRGMDACGSLGYECRADVKVRATASVTDQKNLLVLRNTLAHWRNEAVCRTRTLGQGYCQTSSTLLWGGSPAQVTLHVALETGQGVEGSTWLDHSFWPQLTSAVKHDKYIQIHQIHDRHN